MTVNKNNQKYVAVALVVFLFVFYMFRNYASLRHNSPELELGGLFRAQTVSVGTTDYKLEDQRVFDKFSDEFIRYDFKSSIVNRDIEYTGAATKKDSGATTAAGDCAGSATYTRDNSDGAIRGFVYIQDKKECWYKHYSNPLKYVESTGAQSGLLLKSQVLNICRYTDGYKLDGQQLQILESISNKDACMQACFDYGSLESKNRCAFANYNPYNMQCTLMKPVGYSSNCTAAYDPDCSDPRLVATGEDTSVYTTGKCVIFKDNGGDIKGRTFDLTDGSDTIKVECSNNYEKYASAADDTIEVVAGVNRAKLCMEKCVNEPSCTHFEWDRIDNKCFLKAINTEVGKVNEYRNIACQVTRPNPYPTGTYRDLSRADYWLKQGEDYAGEDIKAVKAPDVQGCAKSCDDTETCTHFTYSYSSKNCWLKFGSPDDKRALPDDIKAVRGLGIQRKETVTKNDLTCTLSLIDTTFASDSNDLLTVDNVFDHKGCVAKCAETSACTHFTFDFDGSRCLLKKGTPGTITKSTNHVAAMCKRAASDPVVVPPPVVDPGDSNTGTGSTGGSTGGTGGTGGSTGGSTGGTGGSSGGSTGGTGGSSGGSTSGGNNGSGTGGNTTAPPVNGSDQGASQAAGDEAAAKGSDNNFMIFVGIFVVVALILIGIGAYYFLKSPDKPAEGAAAVPATDATAPSTAAPPPPPPPIAPPSGVPAAQ